MIAYHTQDVAMPPVGTRQSAWLAEVAQSYGCTIGRINYIFCSDDFILELNRTHLRHDYYTDIITFDYSHAGRLSGDIYISLDTVRSNAGQFAQSYAREFHRVLVHGLLHLTGQADKTPEAEAEMHRKEDLALACLAPEVFVPFS